MSDSLRVVALVGTVRSPSKTKALVELILQTIASRTPIESRIIEIHTLGPGFTGALEREQLDAGSEDAVRAVESADLVIAATPVFRGSYTGLFKHFVDFMDQYALAAKPVMLAATGGSDRHSLVIEHAMRPLFAFLQAWTAPAGIYLSAGDFDGTTILNPEVYERVEMAVDDVVPVARALAAARHSLPG
ncbi:FMN reductase [Streptomyces sp. AK02-01A]|uniref:FMN reductase n=1 Tax=Streptomyces sp. AK02-01A TaxID=3028648 RepID=UPI0029B1A8D4|nr:FMN reductase [Streptomyces sp. AK02-01A]MDX3853448.1 FMN reductase [Streptomyces sp. AK02-01A]